MSKLLKASTVILFSLTLLLISSEINAKDKNKGKGNSYSYDPYYEEDAPHKVHSYGNYEIRDRGPKAPTYSIEAFAKITSSYIWRNVTRNDGPVSEAGFALLASNFTFSMTTYMDLSDYGVQAGYGDQSFEFTEMDLAFSYENKWGNFLYSAELKHYLFPNKFTPIKATGRLENNSTTELNFLLGYDVILNPSLLMSFDVDESKGMYFEIGASHSITKKFWNIPTRINMGGGLGIGSAEFNEYHFGVDTFTMTGVTLRTNWEWMLKKNMILTPELGVSLPFDAKISDAMEKATNIQSSPITVYFSLKFVYKL